MELTLEIAIIIIPLVILIYELAKAFYHYVIAGNLGIRDNRLDYPYTSLNGTLFHNWLKTEIDLRFIDKTGEIADIAIAKIRLKKSSIKTSKKTMKNKTCKCCK